MIKIEAIDVLQQNDDIFTTTNNPLIYFIRFFWYILKGMQWIVSGLENALNEIFKHINFFNSSKVLEFMGNIKPIISSLLVIGILITGYKVMTNTLKEKKSILLNFIIIIVIFSGFQTLLVQLSNLTSTSANTFISVGSTNISENLTKNSIIDLKYLDENNFSDTAIKQKNNINPQNIMKIDPVELMIPDKTNNKEVFSNKLTIDTSGTISTKKLGDGHFLGIGSDIFSEYYYRYKIDWLTLIVTLLCMILSLLWSCIKVTELIYQLGVTAIITPFVAVLDISTGQRTKRVLQKILNIFLVIISVALMYRMYFLGINFIQSINMSTLVKILFIVGFSLGLINGPDIIQELLGIDVGTSASSMFYTSQTLANITRGLTSSPKKLFNSASNVGKGMGKTANAVAGATGYTVGRTKGLNEQKEDTSKTPNNNQKSPSKDNTGSNLNNLHSNNNKNNTSSSNSKQPINDKQSLNNHNINTRNNNDNNPPSINDTQSSDNDNTNTNTNTSNNNDNNPPSINDTQSSKNNDIHSNNPNVNPNNKNNNTSSKYTDDNTTTLNDLVKQKFYDSTFGKNMKSIKNTYNKAKQIGINTKQTKINKSSQKGVNNNERL